MRIALVLAGAGLLLPLSASAQTVDHADVPAMLGWINNARAQHGAGALAEDPRLDAMAEAHSMDMATHHFFDHTSPTRGTPSQRAAVSGITFRELAENIALDQNPRAAFDALMHSPGHYANLMNPNLRNVGLGLVTTDQGVYVTQSFATFDGAQPAVAAVPPVAPPAPADDDDDDTGSPTSPALPTVQSLQGILGSLVPNGDNPANPGVSLPSLANVHSLADLARLASSAQGTNVPVHVTPRRGHHGETAYDVQTPFGTFQVSMPAGASPAPAEAPAAATLRPMAPPPMAPQEPVVATRPRAPRHPGHRTPVEPVAQPSTAGAQPWTGTF